MSTKGLQPPSIPKEGIVYTTMHFNFLAQGATIILFKDA
jgi:hypothetical protein